MTIAGKISLGGSVALSLATAALAFMVSTKKASLASQLRGVEEALRGGKFSTLGFQYTGDYTTDEGQPASSVIRVGEGWEKSDTAFKTAEKAEKAAKEELVEAKAKNQDLTLQKDKLSKDLEISKTDLESTNSKLKVSSEKLQSVEDELKGKKPEELFQEISALKEKIIVEIGEKEVLTNAVNKSQAELSQLRRQLELSKPEGTKSISLSGRILAVNPTWNFVILDLGKKDQLSDNMTLMIYRGDKMIGKIKTTSTEDQTAVADILPGTSARAIEVGDQVVY